MFIYIILKIMVPEQNTKRVKGNKSTVLLHLIPKNESFYVHCKICPTFNLQSISIVEISGHFPDISGGWSYEAEKLFKALHKFDLPFFKKYLRKRLPFL